MQLHYLEFGEKNKNKQSLIILHGLFGSSRNWQSISKQLARNYHVINVDLRNHGKSPHDDVMDYSAMANDVSELINTVQLETPILIGHSMGGKVAMTLALQKLNSLSKLIILDIAPFSYTHNFDVVINAMSSLVLSTLKSRSDADAQMASFINNPELRLFLLHNLRAVDGKYAWQINLDVIKANMPNILGFPSDLAGTNCDLPSYFLAGENSYYVEKAHHASIYEYFPRAKIEYIANASHWLHAEQPRKVIESIQNFIVNQ